MSKCTAVAVLSLNAHETNWYGYIWENKTLNNDKLIFMWLSTIDKQRSKNIRWMVIKYNNIDNAMYWCHKNFINISNMFESLVAK